MRMMRQTLSRGLLLAMVLLVGVPLWEAKIVNKGGGSQVLQLPQGPISKKDANRLEETLLRMIKDHNRDIQSSRSNYNGVNFQQERIDLSEYGKIGFDKRDDLVKSLRKMIARHNEKIQKLQPQGQQMSPQEMQRQQQEQQRRMWEEEQRRRQQAEQQQRMRQEQDWRRRKAEEQQRQLEEQKRRLEEQKRQLAEKENELAREKERLERREMKEEQKNARKPRGRQE